MADPTIDQLKEELLGLIKNLPVFEGRGFSIYNLDDLMMYTELQNWPLVGICYTGSAPLSKPKNATANDSGSAVMCEHAFVVAVGIQYRYAGQEDTKPDATNLLDQIRGVVLGYRGVNSRPWRWMGEQPEPGASDNGTVFYSQVWHTTVPAKGNSNN